MRVVIRVLPLYWKIWATINHPYTLKNKQNNNVVFSADKPRNDSITVFKKTSLDSILAPQLLQERGWMPVQRVKDKGGVAGEPFSTRIGQLKILPYILLQIIEGFSMQSQNPEGKNLSTSHGREIYWILVVFPTTIQSNMPVNKFVKAKI